MVNFNLVPGDRSRFRPDEHGNRMLDASKSCIFPTKWLTFHMKIKNVGVDDQQYFVTQRGLSKALLIDILSRPKEYMEHDFVVLNTEGNYQDVQYFDLKDGDVVIPYFGSTKQKMPEIWPIHVAKDGTQLGYLYGPYRSAYSFNRAMSAYFENYGLVLKRMDQTDSFMKTVETARWSESRDMWLAMDKQFEMAEAEKRKRERREKKLNEQKLQMENVDPENLPSWMRSSPNSSASGTFF